MGDSTSGYPVAQGKDWLKNRLGALKSQIGEVRSLAQAAKGRAEAAFRRASMSGTTLERMDRFGAILTTAQKVALANAKVQWFNEDLGWTESFYVATGTTGLTTRGLIVGAPDGWYPVGEGGPRIRLFSAGGQAHTNGSEFTNWKALAPGTVATENDSYRRGSILSVSGSRVSSSIWGKFHVRGVMYVPNGSGTGVLGMANVRAGSPVVDIQKPIPLLSGFGQIVEFWMHDQFLRASDGVCLRTVAASWTIGGGYSYLDVEYVGPPLTTDA